MSVCIQQSSLLQNNTSTRYNFIDLLCLRPTVPEATDITVSLKSVYLTSGLSADLSSISFSSAKSTPVLNPNEE